MTVPDPQPIQSISDEERRQFVDVCLNMPTSWSRMALGLDARCDAAERRAEEALAKLAQVEAERDAERIMGDTNLRERDAALAKLADAKAALEIEVTACLGWRDRYVSAAADVSKWEKQCWSQHCERDAARAEAEAIRKAVADILFVFKVKAVPDALYASACEIANSALANPAAGREG